MKKRYLFLTLIIGAALTFGATRPLSLTEGDISALLQEYCEDSLANIKITGGSSVAVFTHKLRRTQVVILKCAIVDHVYSYDVAGEDGILVPKDGGGSRFVPYCKQTESI